jgi:hypothetical protein
MPLHRSSRWDGSQKTNLRDGQRRKPKPASASLAVLRLLASTSARPRHLFSAKDPAPSWARAPWQWRYERGAFLKSRPVFAYSSLALVAHAIGRADVTVIVDARRDSWHCFQRDAGLRRVNTSELSSISGLVTPEHFRNWAPLPGHVAHTPYVLADLLPQTADQELLRPTDAPDAFLHEEPSYVTWTPQVHRAPTKR